MPIGQSALYAFRVEMPHGPVLLSHRNIHAKTPAERAFVLREIQKSISQNPDIQFDPRNVWILDNVEELQAMAQALKSETGKPLATELGLDTPNRLITNPEISRNLAGESVPG